MSLSPALDIVIIGLNSSRTLSECIRSVHGCRYPSASIKIFYADGGSTDGSPDIARSLGCVCVEVAAEAPTPGRQRNTGWRLGGGKYVQFLDSDTVMDPDWLDRAVTAIASSESVGAVCGDRREMHPEASLFNRIGDIEWNGPSGDAEAFGGDVLISRSALERVGGYDQGLIAGEDPELAHRIRAAGLRIVKLSIPMTSHDLAMRTPRQYWKRAFRSGHAYAEVHARHPDFWAAEVQRITIRALPFFAGLAVLPLSVHSPWLLAVTAAGLAALLRPRLWLVGRFRRDLGLGREEARTYAWHASMVVVPQCLGMFRFYIGRAISRPLTNRRILASGRALRKPAEEARV